VVNEFSDIFLDYFSVPGSHGKFIELSNSKYNTNMNMRHQFLSAFIPFEDLGDKNIVGFPVNI